MKTKKCSKCNCLKKLSEFYKQKQNSDGLYSWCKSCTNKRNVENRRLAIERMREHNPEEYKRYREVCSARENKRYKRDRERILKKAKKYNARPEVRKKRLEYVSKPENAERFFY